MGGFPALMIRPPESPVQQVGQVLGIQGALQQQQIRGQELQSGNIDLQMKQLALKNMQVTQSALSEPNLNEQFQDWQKSKGTPASGIAASDTGALGGELHPMAQFLAERKGLPFIGPGGALEISKNFNAAAQETANVLKTQGENAKNRLEVYGMQLDNFSNDVAPVLAESDRAKQDSALASFKAKVSFDPTKYPPELVSRLDSINGPQDLASLSNNAKVHQEVISLGTKMADEQKAQAEALLKTQAAAGIRQKDGTFTPEARTAIDTIKTYAAMPPNVRTAFENEMQNAPNMEALQKVQARADSANQSFQRSHEAFAQADAMRASAVGQAMARELIPEDKAWATGVDQTRGIRQMLDMSKGGNETATSAAQVRFAEHEIVEGGVKRMNQLELQSLATSLGDYGRKFQAWVDKGFSGQMPAATNAEMSQILDAEENALNNAHQRNVDMIQNRYSAVSKGAIPPASPRTPQSQTVSVTPPQGATHTAKGSDGKIHWTDATGTVDYGVKQ